jgi:hypothetical protein
MPLKIMYINLQSLQKKMKTPKIVHYGFIFLTNSFTTMITEEEFTKMSLGFEQTTCETKGEVTRFFVTKKKFASIRFCKNRASVKLSIANQDVFCSYNKNVMYPIPNKSASYGWTHINLENIEHEMCMDALTMAYCEVAPKHLAELYYYE